jgi:hypothetical protein
VVGDHAGKNAQNPDQHHFDKKMSKTAKGTTNCRRTRSLQTSEQNVPGPVKYIPARRLELEILPAALLTLLHLVETEINDMHTVIAS